MGRALRLEDGDSFGFGISLYQAAAAAAPHRFTHELLGLLPTLTRMLGRRDTGRRWTDPGQSRGRGSFEDFDLLVEQLAKAPMTHSGKPPKRERRRVGSNPAAHNRALLGDYAT